MRPPKPARSSTALQRLGFGDRGRRTSRSTSSETETEGGNPGWELDYEDATVEIEDTSPKQEPIPGTTGAEIPGFKQKEKPTTRSQAGSRSTSMRRSISQAMTKTGCTTGTPSDDEKAERTKQEKLEKRPWTRSRTSTGAAGYDNSRRMKNLISSSTRRATPERQGRRAALTLSHNSLRRNHRKQ